MLEEKDVWVKNNLRSVLNFVMMTISATCILTISPASILCAVPHHLMFCTDSHRGQTEDRSSHFTVSGNTAFHPAELLCYREDANFSIYGNLRLIVQQIITSMDSLDLITTDFVAEIST